MSEDQGAASSRQGVGIRGLLMPWTLVLLATGLFQLFRGAPIDAAFFLGAAAVLLADGFGLVPAFRLALPGRSPSLVVAAIAGLLLVLSPRHGVLQAVVVAAIGVLVLVFAWPDRPGISAPGTPVRRSAVLWSALAVAVCLIEVSSFLLGLVSEEAKAAHPSISLLLDPVLDTVPGRSVFIVVWLVAGVALLRRGGRR